MANRLNPVPDRTAAEAEIDRLMQLTNLPRPEAAAAVARLCGEEVDDLMPTEPLSDADRERLGLGAGRSARPALRHGTRPLSRSS
jgi:hypothetical protein